MNALQLFENTEFSAKVRAMQDDKGDVWFVGKDVAEALGFKRPSNALMAHVDKSDRNLLTFKAYPDWTPPSLWSGNDFSNKMLINESGVYSLIFESELPKAQEFRHWVTHEVLPQIRKTGGYIPIDGLSDEEMLARATQIAQATIDRMKTQTDEPLTFDQAEEIEP